MGKENLELSKSLNYLARSSIFIFICLIFSKILSYIFKVLIARYYGPDVYGLFSLAWVIFSWFLIFSTLGITESIVRTLSIHKKNAEESRFIFVYSLKTLLVFSFIASVILFFSSDIVSIEFFHEPRLILFLKILSLVLVTNVLALLFSSILRAYNFIREYSLLELTIMNFFRVFLLIILIYVGAGYPAITLSIAGSIILMFICSVFLLKKRIPSIFLNYKVSNKTKKKLSKELLYFSLPMMFLSLLNSIFFWIDSTSLGYLKEVKSVGLYNSAVSLTMFFGLITSVFIPLFFPLIVNKFYEKKKKLVNEISKQISKWIFLINLPLLIYLIVFPEYITNLVFGNNYLIASNALRILAIATFINSFCTIGQYLMLMIGKPKVIIYDLISISIINIILNYFLIRRESIFGFENSNGLIGASLSTLIGVILLNLVILWQVNKSLGVIPFRRKMIRILIISLIQIFLLLAFVNSLTSSVYAFLVSFIIYFAIYLALLYYLGGFDENDSLIINNIIKKLRIKK